MSNALVPSNGSSANFAQQGSVDWVALSGSTFTFSVEVLSRFAKAGVEMITVAMGQAIFSHFKLRPDGQQRFSDAIAKLKAFSSYGKALWFGFGVKHIVRILSETEQGTACAAMCACLSVSYDSLFSSRVLKALTDQQAAPDALTPSLSQWNALLNVCAGAVSNSKFSKQVEGMTRLLAFSATSQNIFLNEPTSPDLLAQALLELGQVSRGDVRSVTLLGGADCGWLAAVSQWLLSLSVDITDELGCLMYSHRSPHCPSYPQVIFVRYLDASRNTYATTLRQRSFFIPPGKLCFGIQAGVGDRPAQHIFSSGRSDWASILHDSFGDSINVLLLPKNSPRFAHFLYCSFSVINDGKGVDHLDPWGGMSATSRERQISHMSFASKRLPELATIFTVGESRAPDTAFGVASSDEFPDELREICACGRCVGSLSQYHLEKISNDVACLEVVAATIFEYIWILSWLDIDEAIYPSPTGLRGLYFKLFQELPSKVGPIYSPYRIKSKFFDQPLASTVISLFTGLSDIGWSSTSSESARCAAGLCVYSSSLKDPTTSPQDQLRATVVPGQIERRGSIFEVVVDKRAPKFDSRLNHVSEFLQAYGPNLGLTLVVDETLASNVLEAYLFISRHPRDQQMGPLFPDHRYLSWTTPSFLNEVRMIGPADIRRKIVFRSQSPICASKTASMHALSVYDNRFVPWTGPCFSAKDILWTNTSKGIKLCPNPNEWILISSGGGYEIHLQRWKEVLRGNYALFYAIICHPLAENHIRLTSTWCLVCSLASNQFDSRASLESLDLRTKNVVMFSLRDSALSMVELIQAEQGVPEC
ncbi:hypothetical protein BGZ57DRAFT_918328 [Hyaloscypha finlandica]|nr:hypothetical protein BGZ57DRAFT_918328 [Hyaloscypha finlandica]